MVDKYWVEAMTSRKEGAKKQLAKKMELLMDWWIRKEILEDYEVFGPRIKAIVKEMLDSDKEPLIKVKPK